MGFMVLTQNVMEIKAQLQKEVYRITAYCACKKCCGKNAKGITATGKKVKVGYIAVDPKVIPLHSKVYIKGLGTFIAEDTGSAIKGKRIDIYIPNHKEALKFGVKYIEAYTL